MSSLSLLFLSVLSLRIQGNDDCKFTPGDGNTTFDLGPLKGNHYVTVNDIDNQHITYRFSLCKNMSYECDTAGNDKDKGPGCAQEWKDNACTSTVGMWTVQPDESWIYNDSTGFGLSFKGRLCYHDRKGDHPYYTQFEFRCDHGTDLRTIGAAVDDHDDCIYNIKVATRHACTDPNASAVTGFSMGYLAIILFFVLVLLAMIGYYVFLSIKSKNWGMQSMAPPLNLCKYFWIFTGVGCKVSMEWVQNKVSKHRGGGDLGDDLVDTDD